MNILSFFCMTNVFTNVFTQISYKHPKPNVLYNSLSKNLKETRHNFYTLNMAKYEHRYIVEKLHNNSIKVKTTLLEKKMMNRRKTDYMFARHRRMISNIHHRSILNLNRLEYTREMTSNHLSQLKEDHKDTLNRLNMIDNLTTDMYNDRYEKHMDDMSIYYRRYKDKREEIKDTINNL